MSALMERVLVFTRSVHAQPGQGYSEPEWRKADLRLGSLGRGFFLESTSLHILLSFLGVSSLQESAKASEDLLPLAQLTGEVLVCGR